MTLTISEEVSMHLTSHIHVCHWQLSVFKQLDLICFYYVLCNKASPLVFQTNLSLLVPKVVVQPQHLDKLFSVLCETFLNYL